MYTGAYRNPRPSDLNGIVFAFEKFITIFSSVGTKQAINFEVWVYSYLEFAKKADTFQKNLVK